MQNLILIYMRASGVEAQQKVQERSANSRRNRLACIEALQ